MNTNIWMKMHYQKFIYLINRFLPPPRNFGWDFDWICRHYDSIGPSDGMLRLIGVDWGWLGLIGVDWSRLESIGVDGLVGRNCNRALTALIDLIDSIKDLSLFFFLCFPRFYCLNADGSSLAPTAIQLWNNSCWIAANIQMKRQPTVDSIS